MLTDFALVDNLDRDYQAYCVEESATERAGGSNPLRGGGGASSLSAASSSSSSSLLQPVEAKVQLLTGGFWPTGAAADGLSLPAPFQRVTASFERYFKDKHSGKKVLQWKHVLGEADVCGYFPRFRKTYTLVVTTLQAMALCRLSEMNQPRSSLGTSMDSSTTGVQGKISRVTTAELQAALNLDVEVVKRVLHSLSCGKFKVLHKAGPGDKKVDLQDEFWPNDDFKSLKVRFGIPMASIDFAASIKAKAVEDRSFVLDACIVRTMKARKRMAHSALIAEVMQQLTAFKPESTAVKKRLEALIEREFLARHEGSDGAWTREYDYLA
jgi:cullin 1